jgi:glutathione synthase
MKIAYILNPSVYTNPPESTTLGLLKASADRGDETFTVYPRDILVRSSGVACYARKLGVSDARDVHALAAPLRLDRDTRSRTGKDLLDLAGFDAVMSRVSSPTEQDGYMELQTLWRVLDLLPEGVFVVNDPRGMMMGSDKTYLLQFPEAIPPTWMSSDPDKLEEVIFAANRGDSIVKPTLGVGGFQVHKIVKDNPDPTHRASVRQVLEACTQRGTQTVLVQDYVPEVTTSGDKRIIVLDGEVLGAFARIPKQGTFLANMAVGGQAVRAEVTSRDRWLVDRVSPRLRADGLHLVGVDVIGDYITEINVVRTGGVIEINEFDSVQLEGRILDYIAGKVEGLHR